MTEIDEGNIYFEPETADDDEDGFFGSTNKHIVAGKLVDMRSEQQQMVMKIIQMVSAHGGITCADGEVHIPERLHKKFKSFLMVR